MRSDAPAFTPSVVIATPSSVIATGLISHLLQSISQSPRTRSVFRFPASWRPCLITRLVSLASHFTRPVAAL
eukprot:13430518-Heterocapsa_arctica.AAC.1